MKLLVPHDGSEHAYKTLDEAVKLAGKLGEGCVNVVIVVPDLCLVDVGIDECNIITNTLYKEAQGIKEKIQQKLAGQVCRAEVQIKTGTAEEVILESAEELGADLIVIGATGKHGGGRAGLGGVAQKVVGKSKRSVLVIK